MPAIAATFLVLLNLSRSGRGAGMAGRVYAEARARSGLTMRQFTMLWVVEEMTGSARGGSRCSPASIARRSPSWWRRLIDQGNLKRRRNKDGGGTNALRVSPAGPGAPGRPEGA